MRIGWIGTGNIGNPMARNLLRTGNEFIVHDLRESATANLIELGARWAASPAAVAEQADVVFTSLPGPSDVELVLTGASGILAGARAGTVYFDLSTNLPAVARRLALVAAERGVSYLDAPVSGGVSGAEAATLAVMVGGDQAAFEAHRPLLEAIGKHIFYLGNVGNGCVAKLVNNLVGLATRHLVNEALVAGVAAGVDARTLYEVMVASSASRIAQATVPQVLERAFDTVSFSLALAAKDIGLAVQMGHEAGAPMPGAAAIDQAMMTAVRAGLGGKNFPASVLYLEPLAGVEVRDRPTS